MPTVQDYNSNRVGNIALLKTKGIFGVKRRSGIGHRYIVTEFFNGKCSGHIYCPDLQDAKRRQKFKQDESPRATVHIYDAVQRRRVA